MVSKDPLNIPRSEILGPFWNSGPRVETRLLAGLRTE